MIIRLTAAAAFALFTLSLPSNEASAAGRNGGASVSRGCLTGAARALLARIEAKFGRVQILSTCRPGARIAGSGRPSRHASGNAIDFNAPSGKKAQLVRWLIATHKRGGTMTYAGMSHVHVDIGQHFVSLGSSRRGRSRSRAHRRAGRAVARVSSTHRTEVGQYGLRETSGGD